MKDLTKNARGVAELYRRCVTEGGDVATAMAEVVPPQPREELTAIVTDMLIGALAFATALLNDEKAGTYALLTLDVHEAATSGQLTVDATFQLFKTRLLEYCVHRPPKSVGLYSVADANALLEHALSNYVRHHKLYQYAFCVRHIVDLQLAPLPYEVATPVPPLAQALTAEQWAAKEAEAEAAAAAEAARLAEEEAAAAEAAREAALLGEYEAAVPDDVAQLVAASVRARVAEMRAVLEEHLAATEAQMLQQLKGAAAAAAK